MNNTTYLKTPVSSKKSLALYLLKIVFSIYLIITLLITLVQMGFEFSQESKTIQTILQTIHSVFESNLSIAASTLDSAQLEANINGIRKIPAIVGIQFINIKKPVNWTGPFPIRYGMILNKNNNIVNIKNNQEILENNHYLTLLPHQFQLKREHQLVGEVILYSSNQVVFNRVKFRFLILIVAAIVKTVAIWILFIWALNKFLGRALTRFCQAMEQVDINTSESMYLDLQHSDIKELYQIETAYNAMFKRVLEVKNKLDTLNKTLEDKVLSRTEELANKNTQLEQLNHEKSEFLSIASHNLKNPLAAIKNFTQLITIEIKNDETCDKLLTYNYYIANSAAKMFDLINNFLDIDKLESGGLEVNLGELDLINFLQTIIASHSQYAHAKSISIDLQTDADGYHVLTDKFLLTQILDNLISNAIKYSPFNKKISISLLKKCATIRIEIQNEGQGIMDDEKKMLFQKFSRLSTKSTAGEYSSGLGLYIAQKMAGLLNTTIECASSVGQYTLFSLEIPLIKK